MGSSADLEERKCCILVYCPCVQQVQQKQPVRVATLTMIVPQEGRSPLSNLSSILLLQDKQHQLCKELFLISAK